MFARDPGYVVDRALYLRNTRQGVSARAWLAQPMALDGAAYDPVVWLATLLTFAQGASADNQGSYAVGIAQKADFTYPPGTSVRDRPLAERDPYTSLVWLAGRRR